ncbi:MAG: hypothetical protein HQK81_06000 [Desulfovibrionaceae bacterium]|nr:hypothetical protein [Desulfovibrionaceae bacterium]MBF0513601.1 hypothetical protein [Desulfovibrionaceae bacterium]
MGQFFPLLDQFPIEDQVKTLADDELLDFWEETQYLDRILEENDHADVNNSVVYERIILQELQLRSSRKSIDDVR